MHSRIFKSGSNNAGILFLCHANRLFPEASTKITAFVFALILEIRSSTFILKVSKLTSTKTGFAPRSSTTFAVAGNEKSEIATSSFAFTPRALSETHSAVVAEVVRNACFAPT